MIAAITNSWPAQRSASRVSFSSPHPLGDGRCCSGFPRMSPSLTLAPTQRVGITWKGGWRYRLLDGDRPCGGQVFNVLLPSMSASVSMTTGTVNGAACSSFTACGYWAPPRPPRPRPRPPGHPFHDPAMLGFGFSALSFCLFLRLHLLHRHTRRLCFLT